MDKQDDYWMAKAIDVATAKGTDPALSPIGSVIILDGELIAAEANQCAELHDPTAHAEMMAIRVAGAALGQADLRGATLYSTLQPCGMCTMALIWSKVRRVVYGAGRDDVHKMYFEARQIDTLDFVQKAYRDDLSITGGCLKGACAKLYYAPDADVPPEKQGNL